MTGAVAAVVWQAGLWQPQGSRFYARGEHAEGEPLPQAHGLNIHHAQAALDARAEAAQAGRPEAVPDTLDLRYGCVWGVPGRNPYKGSVEQALRSAALPEEVVQQVAVQVREGRPIDTLEIRNDGIKAVGSGRTFNAQNVALTFGRSLCIGSRVNFPDGHVETAALYEATTAQGRIVAVMVPEVCGNVSVLGQSADASPGELKARTATDEPLAMRWMPGVLDAPATGAALRSSSGGEVAEPGTLSAVLGALSLWVWTAWRGRRR